jgi:hypothetical protein
MIRMRQTFTAAMLGAVVLASVARAQNSRSYWGYLQLDALKRCLADNTSGKDRKDFVKWIFLAMAAHPELKQYVNSNAATAMERNSRTVAALVTRLLTDDCVNETRAAMRIEPESLRLALEELGELAVQELIADKSVQEAIVLVVRYLDPTLLERYLNPAGRDHSEGLRGASYRRRP